MPGETDVTDLSFVSCFEERLQCTTLGKDPFRIILMDNFVELEEVDPVGPESLQRFPDLVGSRLPVAAIDLGHQEGAVAVAAAECPAHTDLAQPVVVIPAVVKEGDPAVDRGADNADTLRFGKIGHAKMISSQAYHRYSLAGSPEHAGGDGISCRAVHPVRSSC